ncbi:3-phenylpropionate/cinnamic acid dioxygenase subunit beta [Acidocella sp. KAb 2-4]|uniref:3-phenylpropionate/cinnamic acid dioxygenase subunit beta n=1 Tax=Acidocella sp. KAb 2-4 TaxID=2885158 RepID=UPI001D0791C5|nr:3-phenylpropionate/cinnamic acid dioxygenase subunit beta [Acidocella sp. KAb 2-4]MCB5944224.1 3-phenylpropionate/cinnamic acid dioxygenase subunit beta [Acidocella sp. KAb 2-4]
MDDLSAKAAASAVYKVSPELQHEVEQFLYLEAALQDEHRFREWLGLLSEDVRYTLSTNTLAQVRDRRRGIAPPTTYIFNENKYTLERRVARLETGMAWVEEPQSRTRRFITNVRITGQAGDEVRLSCNYAVHRAAKARDHHTFYGTRRDTLRRNGDSWIVVSRELELDEFVLVTANISIFL